MKKLYAPWRHEYVTKKKEKQNNCVFCEQFSQDADVKNLILKRFTSCAITMNYYPYNAGHLMVLPFDHQADLSDLSPQTRTEMMEAVSLSVDIVKKTLACDGFNVGINLGAAAGAGIPAHVHIHILPRWRGDTSFITTIGEVKVVCSDLHAVYDELKEAFAADVHLKA